MPGDFNPPTITSTVKRRTENFNLLVPRFDAPGWGTAMERNLDVLDSVMFTVTGFSNVRGVWDHSTDYAVADRVIDAVDDTIWQAEIQHTSSASGTFEDERTANPTYWIQVQSSAVPRGDWTTTTNYNAGEFVTDQGRTGIVTNRYTSGASYNADVANGDIVTLVDTSAFDEIQVAINQAGAATIAVADEIGFVDVSNSNALAKTTLQNFMSAIGAAIAALTAKASPVDADGVPITDSQASGVAKFLSFTNMKAFLKTYFDTLYQPLSAILTNTTASFTAADETKLDGIEALADVTDAVNVGSSVAGAAAKTTPVDADSVWMTDSEAANVVKRLTFANLANWIALKFGLYGMIFDYGGATAPTGFSLCYGQTYLRSNTNLFNAIGTVWGVGDGVTTANLPDLRGRVTAGQDDMGGSSANRLTGLSGGVNGDTLAATGGAESHVLTEAQLPSHDHPYRAGDNGSSAGPHIGGGGFQGNENTVSTDDAGNDEAHNNVQPTAIVNKIMFTGF